MNDTPRTDAAETAACDEYERTREAGYPPFDASVFDTARTLERENAELRAKLADAEREINALTEWGKSVDEKTSKLFLSMSEQLDAALARAEAAEKERDVANSDAKKIGFQCDRIATARDAAHAEIARLRGVISEMERKHFKPL
jgi:chromosome segregation ATPase